MCNFADVEQIKDELFSGYNPMWNHVLTDEIFTKLTREIMRRHGICESAKEFLMRFEQQAFPAFLSRYNTLLDMKLEIVPDLPEDITFWRQKIQEEIEGNNV